MRQTYTITFSIDSEIIIKNGIRKNITSYLMENSYTGCFLLFDSTTEKLFKKDILQSLPENMAVKTTTIKPGEQSKTFITLGGILKIMLENNFDRKAVLIAVGGGVVGDIAAMAAALYKRGIDCVQIPTTLLAQIDSSIGGKGGVNMSSYKNMVGITAQPRYVFIDPEILKKLPNEQFRQGMAEIIKYAIANDKRLFEKLQNTKNVKQDITTIIQRCVAIKMGMIKKDPLDTKGIRMSLNFGHTLGHAIELTQNIPHGEAIAIGMNFAIKLSQKIGLLPANSAKKAVMLLTKYDLPLTTFKIKQEQLFKIMRADKKNIGNKIHFVLLQDIGKTVIRDNVSQKLVEEVLKEIIL